MNLYDKSSLILIPSAVKDGKVYSQRPENGDGDFTFSRASTATRVNENGLIESVGSNEPRLDYSGGASCPSLLLEPQRTNLITHSEDINSISGLSKIGASIDANVTTSPEGLLNASLLKEDSSNGSHFAYKDFNLTNGATYTISIFAKANGENRRLRFGDGGVGWSSGFSSYFNLFNGTVSGDGVMENYGNGWYRCSVVGTTNATASRLIVYSTLNTQTSYQGDGVSGVYLYGFQIEEASYPSSYIPTYGSAVTRSRENHQLNITSIITSLSFTWFFDLGDWVGSLGNSGTYELINTGSTRIQLRVRVDGYRMYYQNTNGGSSYPVAGSQSANKFCVAYDGFNYRLFIDGTLVNTYPSVGDTNWSFLMNVNGSGVNETLIIKQEMLFNTALTDSECIALTTI